MSAATAGKQGHALHAGIAEAGKLCALSGDHDDALRHYREALRMAQASQAPEVFFRHYTQCVLESLEQTGSHAEVMEFCENALHHFESIDRPLTLHLRDQAATLERLAINLLKVGRAGEARERLEQAVALAATDDIPVARTVLDWLRRGMTPQLRQIRELQDKYRYFTVCAERVEAARAVPLPAAQKGRAVPL